MGTNQRPEFVPVEELDFYQDYLKNQSLALSMKTWRKCEELTQTEVARRLGVSKQLYSDYERGVKLPSLKRTIEIAQILGAPTEFWITQRIEDELKNTDYTAKIEVRHRNSAQG